MSTLDELLVMTGCRDPADLEDMAKVGKALMERIADATESGPLKGWSPMDCPTEIVTDLADTLDEAQARLAKLEAALRDVRGAIMEHAPDTLWVSLIETAVDSIDAALGSDTEKGTSQP